MSRTPSRWIATSLVVAASGGVLAGCGGSDDESTASAGSSDAAATTTTATTTDDGGSTAASGSSSSSGYRDGTYTAEGGYKSPNGDETVGVKLTIADGKVSAVEVTPQATNPNSKRFQGEFADGISGEVVGRSLDDLQVSKVSGSSLTSGGFNAAVEQIKSDAAA